MFKLVKIITIVIILVLDAPGLYLKAQSNTYMVYIWQNRVYAQAINSSTTRELGLAFMGIETTLPDNSYDIYNINRIILDTIDHDYGLYHGVWDKNRTQFAYLIIQSGGTGYQVRLADSEGVSRTLLSGNISDTTGYLDPIAWTKSGTLLLSDRYRLNRIDVFRIWELNLDTGELSAYFNYR